MSTRPRILLLEDDANFGSILQEHLQMQGFDVVLCVNGEEGFACFLQNSFDICLVDVMMPKMDGFTFARNLRAYDNQMPLIFLTARSMKEDKIEGFRIGCDDYITKPFSIEELLLRIQAVLRRSTTNLAEESAPAIFAIGNYTFDYNRRSLILGERYQKLTPREADLLRLLAVNINTTLAREKALRDVWGDESYFTGRSMDVFISRLRKYLKGDSRVEIVSIHGKGFRLTVNS